MPTIARVGIDIAKRGRPGGLEVLLEAVVSGEDTPLQKLSADL